MIWLVVALAAQASPTIIHPLPGPQAFPESVAVDPASGRYWAKSVKDGTIFIPAGLSCPGPRMAA